MDTHRSYGIEPPLLKFSSEEEFHQELNKYEHTIYLRTLYAIKSADSLNIFGDITIAFLNDEDTLLGCPKDCWVSNLQRSLEYFVSIEDYEKCTETKELIQKLLSN